MRRAICAALLVGALVATGCSSHKPSASALQLSAMTRALDAAHTVRVRVQYFGSGTQKSKVENVMLGQLDFVHGAGDYRSASATPTAAVESVFRNGAFYERLTSDTRVGFPNTVLAGRHWIQYTYSGSLLGQTGGGQSPYEALDELRRAGATLRDHGATRVDGVAVRRYSTSQIEPEPAALGHATLRVEDDLYVDDRDRLVRVDSFTSRPNSKTSSHVQYDFSQYGAPVSIPAPARSDVVVYSDDYIPTPHLSGGWTNVASGVSPNFTWKLYRARADDDRVCWSFETEPALSKDKQGLSQQSLAQLRALLGATGTPPRHDGRDAVCSRTGAWQSDLQEIAGGTIDGHELTVVVLGPNVVSVRRNDEIPLPTTLPSGGSLSTLPLIVGSGGGSTVVPIDRRFDGFIDLGGAFPSLGVGSYTVKHRDGSRSSCEPRTPVPGEPDDSCEAFPVSIP